MTGAINILSASQSAILNSIQNTQRSISGLQNQLATGKRVNSAIENPQNFFAAKRLQDRAGDLSRLLDGIGQSIRTVQLADSGREGLEALVNQAEAVTTEARQTLLANSTDMSALILKDEPIIHFPMNAQSSTTTLENLGTEGASINGTFTGGFQANALGGEIYEGIDGNSFEFDGVNDRILLPNSDSYNTDVNGYYERTIELTFQADDVQSRQTLYYEGGGTNTLNMYIENGRAYVTGRNGSGGAAARWGPFDISAEIKEGQTYHLALEFNAYEGYFRGYLDGEIMGENAIPGRFWNHARGVIGFSQDTIWYHDGQHTGGNIWYSGKMTNFAMYDKALGQEKIAARAEAMSLPQMKQAHAELQKIYDQIDPLVSDANYRGINLLKGESLETFFNETRTSSLITQGVDFTALGLGLTTPTFQRIDDLDATTDRQLREARTQVRQFGTTLATNLGIIQSRQDFTQSTINSLNSGADDLTVADQNELGAELLSQQVRQSLQFESLAFSARQLTIADFIG